MSIEVQRAFPIWQIWRFPRYWRNKKAMELYLAANGEYVEDAVNRAARELDMHGEAKINLAEYGLWKIDKNNDGVPEDE